MGSLTGFIPASQVPVTGEGKNYRDGAFKGSSGSIPSDEIENRTLKAGTISKEPRLCGVRQVNIGARSDSLVSKNPTDG
jgi:hypothetical protein